MTREEIHGVLKVIWQAYRCAVDADIQDKSAGQRNAKRSQRLVQDIAKGLRGMFAGPGYADRNVGVLAKGINSTVRGLAIKQEFLYDVHAFEYDVVGSPARGASVCVVKGSLVQLESELARDNKAICTDFNKLVCGKADFKVMIMPRVKTGFKETLNLLRGIANCIPEPLALVVIPYPEDWGKAVPYSQEDIQVFWWEVTDGGGIWNLLNKKKTAVQGCAQGN